MNYNSAWRLERGDDGIATLTIDRSGGSANTLGRAVLLELEARLAKSPTISVPTIPRSRTSAPPSAAPSMTAAAIEGAEIRMSRPTAIECGSKCST